MSLDVINKALLYPNSRSSSFILLSASDYLYRTSPHYRALNQYFSKMPLFNWGVDTYDIFGEIDNKILLSLEKKYDEVCSRLEKFNIKHEFYKIMNYLPYQDVYYGLVVGDDKKDETVFFQRLDPSMCEISSIQEGVYKFKMNLGQISECNLSAYPTWLQEVYLKLYRDNNNSLLSKDGRCYWYEPPSDKQICLKFSEHLTYPFPFLLNLVSDIFDLSTYKKLNLQAAKTDNYAAIVNKIPIDSKSVDAPLVTIPMLEAFATLNADVLPEDVGYLHVLGDVTPVSFKNTANTRNNVGDGNTSIFQSAGVPETVLGSQSSAGTALTYAIEGNASYIYAVYRQIEAWFKRFIKIKKLNTNKFKFALYIQDSTVFNRDKIVDKYLKLAQYGIPVKRDIAISIGKTPSQMKGSFILENQILKLHENLIPLSSTFTGGGEVEEDSNGRKTNEEKGIELSPEGEKTQDTEGNDR